MTLNLAVRSAVASLASVLLAGGVASAHDTDDLDVRARLAGQIVATWGGHVATTYGVEASAWARRMDATFESASLDDLRRASEQSDFLAMSNELLGRSGDIAPLALGDPEGNLVYTPIVPCRIVDTRIVGGPIAAGSTRNFVAATGGSFAAQGGIDGHCGVPLGVSAVSVSLSVAGPAMAGYLTTHPANAPTPLAASLTFQGKGQNDTNGTVISLCHAGNCQPDFTTLASREANVVIDVTGYFSSPAATALDCVTAVDSGQLNLLATVQPRSVECPAGYSATGGGCGGTLGIGVSYSRPAVTGGQNIGWSCGLVGSILSVLSYEVSASCCRIPGH